MVRGYIFAAALVSGIYAGISHFNQYAPQLDMRDVNSEIGDIHRVGKVVDRFSSNINELERKCTGKEEKQSSDPLPCKSQAEDLLARIYEDGGFLEGNYFPGSTFSDDFTSASILGSEEGYLTLIESSRDLSTQSRAVIEAPLEKLSTRYEAHEASSDFWAQQEQWGIGIAALLGFIAFPFYLAHFWRSRGKSKPF